MMAALTARRRQPGTASVELAVIFAATFVLLPAVFLFARAFLQYGAIKEGTRNAALYLATLPPAAMIDDTERAIHIAKAGRIVREAVRAGGMGLDTELSETMVVCDDHPCTGGLPDNLGLVVTLVIEDKDFSGFTANWTDQGEQTWEVSAHSVASFATAEFKLP